MAPIKSSLAKSAKQLLGLFNTADLGLRGATQSTRFKEPSKTVATGGTKFTSGNQTYHLFHTSSTLVMANDGGEDLTAEIFLVAGGGAGTDGGGGAGGIRNVPSITLSAGETWTCTVGAGGNPSGGPAGSASGRPNWSPGSSQANDLVGRHTDFYFQPVSYPNPKYYRAIGGGKGGVWGNGGGPGGSGGGAGNRGGSPGGAASSDNGTPITAPNQFGSAGGESPPQGEGSIGSGGGGAGGAGVNGATPIPTATRGNGGAGQPFPAYASPIIGPQLSTAGVPGPEVTAFNSAVGPTGLYGGGGGGGGRQPGDDSGTAGGPGGGGAGGSGNSAGTAGEPGIKYTGGGGGGGGFNAPNTAYGPGGGGGTGIIIIKYPT